MRHDKIPGDLRDLAFEFFYWFSRFEFALKAFRYLKSKVAEAKAEPDWRYFVVTWQDRYVPSSASRDLVVANPQRQVVAGGGALEFRDLDFEDGATELAKVVSFANTVRNNLFHGGKHGNENWDNPQRMRQLLRLVITVLDELAELAGIEADYRRYY